MPTWFYEGKKAISDYGDYTFEDRLATDDFGNTFDPRKHTGDVDFDSPLGRPNG